MRDITRLALVTAISFGVVGTAMMSANNGGLRIAAANILGAAQQLAADVVGGFASQTPPATPTLPAGTQLLRIPRPDPPHWAGLQGFPDTTDIAFRLPTGIVVQSGTLDLVLHSELASSGDGRVGVWIDGTLRSENVLAVGTQTISVSVPLAASDLLGSVVEVELTSQGTTGSGQMCPTDAANSGSVVAIDATSSLSLVMATPVLGPELALLGASEPLQVALDAGEGGARAIWGRQRLTRGGLDVALASPVPAKGQFTVVADGSPSIGGSASDYLLAGTAGLDRLLALQAAAPTRATAWPVSVFALKADTTLKTFRGVQRWSLTYALADLPGGVLPGELTLAIASNQLAAGSDWLLSVALNGVLVQSSRLAGQAALLTVIVPLAAELQELTNTISIDLVDTSPNLSVCRTGPDARAQISATSQLLALAPQPTTGWSTLIARLSHDSAIHLAVAGDVDLSEAARLSDLLGEILPATSTAVFGGTTAPRHLVMVGSTGLAGALLASAPAGTAADPRLLILSAPRAGSMPTLVALEGADLAVLTASMEAGDVAILVTD